MSVSQHPAMPRAQITYGEIIYWLSIVAAIICAIGPTLTMLSPENNIVNPYYLFSAIFEGKSPGQVWEQAGSKFPGGHFYLKHFRYGDGFTQFGLALGCSSALWGLLLAAYCFAREKNILYTILSLWVALLVFTAMVGLGKAH